MVAARVASQRGDRSSLRGSVGLQPKLPSILRPRLELSQLSQQLVNLWIIYGEYMVNLWIIYRYAWWLSYIPLKNMKLNLEGYNQYMEKHMLQSTNQTTMKSRFLVASQLIKKRFEHVDCGVSTSTSSTKFNWARDRYS